MVKKVQEILALKHKYEGVMLLLIILGVILGFSLLSTSIQVLLDLYIDRLWFREIKLESLFFTPLYYNVIAGLVVNSLTFTGVYLVVSYLADSLVVHAGGDEVKIKRIKKIFLLLVIFWLLKRFIDGFPSYNNDAYLYILSYQNATPFNVLDPVFHKDVSFYVFKLPFLRFIFEAAEKILARVFILTLVFLFLAANIYPRREGELVSQEEKVNKLNRLVAVLKVIAQFIAVLVFLSLILSILGSIFGALSAFVSSFGAVLVLLFAAFWIFRVVGTRISKVYHSFVLGDWLNVSKKPASILVSAGLLLYALKTYFIGIPELLYRTSDVIPVGASYADVTIRLPYLKILILLLVLVAATVFLAAFIRNNSLSLKLSIGTLVFLMLYVTAGLETYNLTVRFIVKPNELRKESTFIGYHIDFTRKAWGLDKIEEKTISGGRTLTALDVKNNQQIFNNIRVWDREQLLEVFKQTQSLRSYYDFVTVDDDRYTIGGEYRQIMLSPRELNLEGLSSRSFINDRIIYTHGIGIVAAPAAETTNEGLPLLVAKDIPTEGLLNTTRTQIYFGENKDWSEYILVNTKTDELDYPLGENNIYTQYQGKAGITIDTFWKRLVFAIKFRDANLFFTKEITPKTRLIIEPNIGQRVSKAFPFLRGDPDNYIVVNQEGKLKWIKDGFTYSEFYPYSMYDLNKEGAKKNYLRNPVKFVVDAYDGDIKAYVADPNDPIIQTYMKIFPGIFQPLEEMDFSLRGHLRYPTPLLVKQSQMYTIYHMDDVKVFYNKEDQWDIPEGETRHLITRLPGERNEEFILMVPFTPRGKSNLTNWLAARSDQENYGKIVSFYLSKQKLVYGPDQVKARVDQDPVISQQKTLWDQKGSQVVMGGLFVIPIEDTFIYVQPLYLYSMPQKSIPELRAVVMAHKDKIVMGKNIDDALGKLFTE